MDRLTKWNSEKGIYESHDGEEHQLAIDLLAHYENTGLYWHEIKDHEEMFKSYRHICGGKSPEEIKTLLDAEEQGLLIKLPCKVGDTVYIAYLNRVIEGMCHTVEFTLNYESEPIYFITTVIVPRTLHLQLGKTVFLTREAAEQTLKVGTPT